MRHPPVSTTPAPLHRRAFLTGTLLAAAALPLGAAKKRRKPRLLVRSAWQTVNIGDIAHTPGLLALIEKHLPDAEVTLWPGRLDRGVDALLQRRFPKLRIAADTAAQAQAIADCDLMLHGSGPSLVGQSAVEQWRRTTGKPFGIFGVTLSAVDEKQRDLLSAAAFVYCRDSLSLKVAKDAGVRSPVLEFGPDAAFACDLTDDAAADAFLAAQNLEPGKFLCCIPRWRFTPYWEIHGRKVTPGEEHKPARNAEMVEQDHGPLREAICQVVRGTDLKVLLCPEDLSQMALGKSAILDKLPEDVKPKVAWRETYWLTGEARSVHARSAGLFGLEMHSPIMCIGQGVPALVGRFQEQTSKGLMWKDIGLTKWLFDMDEEADRQRYPQTVMAMARDPDAARKRAVTAQEKVQALHARMMQQVATSLGAEE